MPKRIIVKIGSQVLCDPRGHLNVTVLNSLVDQVADLAGQGWQTLLVSSGAVAAGSGLLDRDHRRFNDPVTRRQVLAATGQVQLMETYQNRFREHGLSVAQVLTSKSDFQTRRHYLNMRNCIEALLDTGIVPVVNENDVVSVSELMFTDNDELAGLVAGMVNADLLCLLSNVVAVYDGDPGREDVQPIATWDDGIHEIGKIVQLGTSKLGRGGMHSKLAVARKTAGLGTEVVIADGAADDILLQIVSGEPVGTRFPAKGGASPTKRWLASADSYAAGYVTINEGAEAALLDDTRLTSLLPVGIESVHGKFRPGDIIRIQNRGGKVIGCGRVRYDYRQAREMQGQKGKKALIHYDYLYLME